MANVRTPLNFFGRFETDSEGRVDLKMHGLFPLVGAARLLSIKARAPERSTAARYRAAAAAELISDADAADLTQACHTIMAAILRQQLLDVDVGRIPGPKVDPSILDKSGQKALRKALRRSLDAVQIVREGVF